MATFYLLPPRPTLGDFLARSLESLLPGLACEGAGRRQLAELLLQGLVLRENVYVVHREELPAGESVEDGLVHAFGAEDGDEVVEVRVDRRGEGCRHLRWRIGETMRQVG